MSGLPGQLAKLAGYELIKLGLNPLLILRQAQDGAPLKITVTSSMTQLKALRHAKRRN
jgi:hypothetical protein